MNACEISWNVRSLTGTPIQRMDIKPSRKHYESVDVVVNTWSQEFDEVKIRSEYSMSWDDLYWYLDALTRSVTVHSAASTLHHIKIDGFPEMIFTSKSLQNTDVQDSIASAMEVWAEAAFTDRLWVELTH